MAEASSADYFNADTRASLTDVGLDVAPAAPDEIRLSKRDTVATVNWLTIPDMPSDIPQEAAVLIARIERETVEGAVGLSQEDSLDFDTKDTSPKVGYPGSLMVQGRGVDGTIRQAYVADGRQLATDFEERPLADAEREEPAMLEVALRLGDLVNKHEVTEIRFIYQDGERRLPLLNDIDTDPEWATTDKFALPVFDLTQAIPQNTPGTTA